MTAPRYHGLALALLIVGNSAQFLWRAAPAELQGDAWNALQALFNLSLLGLIALIYQRARAVVEVCALLASWQLMTAGCSLAFMVHPWTVQEGAGQCSAALNLPLGAISGLVAIVLAWRLYEWRNRNGR